MCLCLQIDAIFSSPVERATENARTIADLQSLAGFPFPSVQVLGSLNNRDWGSLEGKNASEVTCSLMYRMLFSGLHMSIHMWCGTEAKASVCM